MNTKRIVSTESSPVVKIAALVIIFAGAIYAKSIITPFLLALFISIICAQPVAWLETKRIPRWLAILLGTPTEAEIYLKHEELLKKQILKKPLLKKKAVK